MPPIVEFAAAKVNLSLKVLRRREDGYHDIESVVAFADIGDRLTLDLSGPERVRTAGPFAASIIGANLVARALDALRAAEPRLALGASTLEKTLPVAAGLGGGSADAAALLRAVQRANPNLSRSLDWQDLAAGLGADVPVCLSSRAALIRGKGDLIAPLPVLPAISALLVCPQVVPVPDKTARVFGRLALRAAPARPSGSNVYSLSSLDDVVNAVAEIGNDLLEPAMNLWPALPAVLETLRELPGRLASGLSGAGPTCFALFASPGDAQAAAAAIARRRPDWWIAATTLS